MNVNTPVKAVIYGRDHESPGEIYVHALDALGAALGTSPGTTAKPNEDAAGIVARGRDMVLAIADGHWGREASEIAIARSMELHNPDASVSVESQIRERLFSLFEQVNDRLYELGSSNPGSRGGWHKGCGCTCQQGLDGNQCRRG